MKPRYQKPILECDECKKATRDYYPVKRHVLCRECFEDTTRREARMEGKANKIKDEDHA